MRVFYCIEFDCLILEVLLSVHFDTAIRFRHEFQVYEKNLPPGTLFSEDYTLVFIGDL